MFAALSSFTAAEQTTCAEKISGARDSQCYLARSVCWLDDGFLTDFGVPHLDCGPGLEAISKSVLRDFTVCFGGYQTHSSRSLHF